MRIIQLAVAAAAFFVNTAFADDNLPSSGKDRSQAVDEYRKAADRGDSNAQFRLAMAYFYGAGIEEDRAKALEYIEKAADGGNCNAMLVAAHFFAATRNGVVKSSEWFGRALDECGAGSGVTQQQIEETRAVVKDAIARDRELWPGAPAQPSGGAAGGGGADDHGFSKAFAQALAVGAGLLAIEVAGKAAGLITDEQEEAWRRANDNRLANEQNNQEEQRRRQDEIYEQICEMTGEHFVGVAGCR